MQLVDYDPFATAELTRVVPSTAAQKEIWIASRMGADVSCAFNECVSLHLSGPLDSARFKRAFQRLIELHEILRCTFSPDDGRLCVAAQALIAYREGNLAESALPSILAAEVETPFDLENGPLVRGRLDRLFDNEYRFTLTAHHSVCDGWSLAVLLRDLGHCYAGTAPPEAQPFSEYMNWLESDEVAEQRHSALAYWIDRLKGDLPTLQLPTDRPHQPVRTFRANRLDHAISPETTRSLKRAAGRAGVSFFTFLFTAFAGFLHRLTGQQDLIIGVPAAGQSTSGLTNVVGHCVNLLPIRCAVDPRQPFGKCLSEARTAVLDAYDHQQLTYGELLPHLKLRRDASRPPLVSVAFNLEQAVKPSDLPFPGLEVSFHSNPRHFENFELFVNAAESVSGLVLECQYNVDLFDRETIADRMESFEAFLMAAATMPEEAIGRLSVLSREQQETILVKWNETAIEYPRETTVAQLLGEQAARTPDRLALVFEGQSLTYAELDRRANRSAHGLIANGVEPGSLVGLCLERSVEAIVGMLAILKAGAGYVPLDPKFPRDRLTFMLDDSGATALLTDAKSAGVFAGCKAKSLDIAEVTASSDAPVEGGSTAADLAYVIYTSGSTGKPKGVAVPNDCVVSLLTTMRQSPGITENDTLLAVTTLSFDMSVTEIVLPLSVGATIVLASREATSDGRQLLKLLQSSGATIMQGTPATWRMLLQAGWTIPMERRLTAWCGGEAMSPDLAAELLPRVKALWNLYGPTETTVYSTGGVVTDPHRITIGKPVGNSQTYILDQQGQPVPVGVPGELYLGGAGVARGYLNRDELTRERFVDNPYHDPFAEYLNPRLYRTGDLVRWRRGGEIEYFGRNDHQVKLRGMRIELGEIEAVIAAHPAIRQVVAAIRTDRADDPRLTAYHIPAARQSITTSELRKHVRQKLPDYMVPQHFVELDALPLTANGKVDRNKLPAPFAVAVAPPPNQILTPSSRYLLDLCRELLGVPSLNVDDNFFQVGGHSLLAMQVLARIEKDKGVRLSPRLLIVNTLGQVSENLG